MCVDFLLLPFRELLTYFDVRYICRNRLFGLPKPHRCIGAFFVSAFWYKIPEKKEPGGYERINGSTGPSIIPGMGEYPIVHMWKRWNTNRIYYLYQLKKIAGRVHARVHTHTHTHILFTTTTTTTHTHTHTNTPDTDTDRDTQHINYKHAWTKCWQLHCHDCMCVTVMDTLLPCKGEWIRNYGSAATATATATATCESYFVHLQVLL